jgi:hypothetical protein
MIPQVNVVNEELIKKWGPVLDHPDLPKITDPYKRNVTAVLLENTERDIRETRQMIGGQFLAEAAPANATGGIENFDPILISLVRRAAPNLVAYDICGVQPMTGPTGLIFALRARYTSQSNGGGGPETFYNEVNTAFSAPNTAAANTQVVGGAGLNLGTQPTGNAETYNYQRAIVTADAEALGGNATYVIPEMAISIEKVTVTARSRALKAEYTLEMAQDLKAIHGLDAESELSNILSTEMLSEINREVVRLINLTASAGATAGVTTAGTFDLDTDSNGRWSVEKFKGLMFQIEREANQIAKGTRRGKGNILLCSSDVASALGMAGILSYTPALDSNQINPDDTGVTFVGVLNNRMRVFIDPYSVEHYFTAGYKGASPFDAGIFYCPYVPLQMVRAVDPNSFQPKIGFKTRYGMVANPFAEGLTQGFGALDQNSNLFYRRVLVSNLL